MYIARNEDVIWRDIAGEIVIAERDNKTIRVLNKTASLIWSLADGNKQIEDLAMAVFNRFDVTSEKARADTEEFCQQLLVAGLITFRQAPEGTLGGQLDAGFKKTTTS